MTSLTETPHTGEFILSESPGTISRDQVVVTVGTATKLSPGQVLGQLSATGKYVPFDETATDGSESAAGVLYGELDNTDGEAPTDFDGVVIDFAAEVVAGALIWGDADADVGTPQLAALGVKAR